MCVFLCASLHTFIGCFVDDEFALSNVDLRFIRASELVVVYFLCFIFVRLTITLRVLYHLFFTHITIFRWAGYYHTLSPCIALTLNLYSNWLTNLLVTIIDHCITQYMLWISLLLRSRKIVVCSCRTCDDVPFSWVD